MSEYVLIHHGVKGMKWGVRRYQNKDGSLTAEGKRHASNRDSDNLAKALGKHAEAYAVYDTNTKRYYNRQTGNTLAVGDPKHGKNAQSTKASYENLKATLSKKYDSVDAKTNIDYKKGRATVTAVLKKNGETYVSELESTFDPVTEEYYDSLWQVLDN